MSAVHIHRKSVSVPGPVLTKMHAAAALLVLAASCLWSANACDLSQTEYGCKIYRASCTCGYGCKTEYIYRSRDACMNAVRERRSNVCDALPCLRGICIQTVQDPGFACKCEGTGFYGIRCEKTCPTTYTRRQIFPHECIVI